MRVSELGGDADLLQEPLRDDRCGEFRVQHFHGDRALVLEVLGHIDGGHATAPKHALQLEPLRKGGTETLRYVAHPLGSLAVRKVSSTLVGQQASDAAQPSL